MGFEVDSRNIREIKSLKLNDEKAESLENSKLGENEHSSLARKILEKNLERNAMIEKDLISLRNEYDSLKKEQIEKINKKKKVEELSIEIEKLRNNKLGLDKKLNSMKEIMEKDYGSYFR